MMILEGTCKKNHLFRLLHKYEGGLSPALNAKGKITTNSVFYISVRRVSQFKSYSPLFVLLVPKLLFIFRRRIMAIKPNVKLKVVLMEKGLTQRNLAFGTNIDESRISKIIKGYEKPTGDMKEAISDYLTMEQQELFPQ
jgi:hypothetical protein